MADETITPEARDSLNLRISVACVLYVVAIIVWLVNPKWIPLTELLLGIGIGLCVAPRLMKDEVSQ